MLPLRAASAAAGYASGVREATLPARLMSRICCPGSEPVTGRHVRRIRSFGTVEATSATVAVTLVLSVALPVTLAVRSWLWEPVSAAFAAGALTLSLAGPTLATQTISAVSAQVERRGCTPGALVELANSAILLQDEAVWLASRSECPPCVLERLVLHWSSAVRVCAAYHPNAPSGLNGRLSRFDVEFAVKDGHLLSEHAWDAVACHFDVGVRCRAAASPDVPAAALERLAFDGQPDVRAAALGNPLLPEHVRAASGLA